MLDRYLLLVKASYYCSKIKQVKATKLPEIRARDVQISKIIMDILQTYFV